MYPRESSRVDIDTETPMKTEASPAPQIARAGWKLNTFCEAAGLSRSYIYMLPEPQRPHSVKVGKRRVIIEPPTDWLKRIGVPQNGGRHE